MTISYPDEHRAGSGINHLQRHRDSSRYERTPFFVAISKLLPLRTTKQFVVSLRGSGLSTHSVVEPLVPPTVLPASLGGWWPRYGKRCFDIVFASFALVLLSPAMILIAILVCASGQGRVIFKQQRYGRDCKLFSIYKFQTMVNDSHDSVVVQTKEHDRRVTRLGAFLRRTSLDEIPQFFNVLVGDMSIVGPRPHAPMTAIGDTYFDSLAATEQYRVRFSINPGITGLAQVSGCRGAMPTREIAIRRLENDVRYVRELSPWLDMKIIMRTLVSEFVTGRAY